jgi:hypothetical protein
MLVERSEFFKKDFAAGRLGENLHSVHKVSGDKMERAWKVQI